MGGIFSISHLLIVAFIILVIFGAGKIPSIMADMGKGIKDMRKAVTDETHDPN